MVKLFVGNLPPSASNQSLKEIFQQYKDLQDFKLISNYGFVYLETEESAIHAVNNLNGLEYRGFPLAIDFAREHSKLKRKADVVNDNRIPKQLLPPPPQRFPPPTQLHNSNPYNLPFLNPPNNGNRPFDNISDRRFITPQYNNGYNNNYHDNYDDEYNSYPDNRSYPPMNFPQVNDFYDRPMPSCASDFYHRPPPFKRMRPDQFIDDESYDYNYNGHFMQEMQHPDMFRRQSNMSILKRPNWYDTGNNKNQRQFLLPPDQPMYAPRRGGKKQQPKKSYIDEYEDNNDYSSSDPYPAYLKQYQK